MNSTSEAALMGMLGAFCHWGVFINKVNYPSDEEIVFYVTIPEKSFGYVNNGLVDMSTPEKFIKNIKEKLIDGPFKGVNIRMKYKIRENESWTKDDGDKAVKYNDNRIVNKQFPVMSPK
jgi:hypothetical protein